MISRQIDQALRAADVAAGVQEALARVGDMRRFAAEPFIRTPSVCEAAQRASATSAVTAMQQAAAKTVAEPGVLARMASSVDPGDKTPALHTASHIAELRRPMADLQHRSMADLQYPLSRFFSGYGATPLGATAAQTMQEASWRPALERWTQPSFRDLLAEDRMGTIRAISEAVRPLAFEGAAVQAARGLGRSPIVPGLADVLKVRVPSYTPQPVPEPPITIPLWPEFPAETPEASPDQEERPGVPPTTAPDGTNAGEIEVLRRRIETLERSPGRIFVAVVAGRVIGGTIQDYIWEYTPVGEYIDVAIKEILVYIEGAHYVLPYIAP